MKKIKLGLIALGSIIGIGGAVAATSQLPGQYFTSATGSNVIPGQKDVDWECTPSSVTCAYYEELDGSRTRITGLREQIEP